MFEGILDPCFQGSIVVLQGWLVLEKFEDTSDLVTLDNISEGLEWLELVWVLWFEDILGLCFRGSIVVVGVLLVEDI